MTDVALSSVYLEEIPCQTEDNRAYHFTISPRVPKLGESPSHIKYVLRHALFELSDWPGVNYCRGMGHTALSATTTYGGETISEVFVDESGAFSMKLSGAVPSSDPYSKTIESALTQNGVLYGEEGRPPEEFDYLLAVATLSDEIAEVDKEKSADLRYLIGVMLHHDYNLRFQKAKAGGNFDAHTFNTRFRDIGSEEFFYLFNFRESAMLGSAAGILRAFKESPMPSAIFNIMSRDENRPFKMPQEQIEAVLGTYGFLFDAGFERNVGRIVAIAADANADGYTISDGNFFLDMTRPPGAEAIERAVNARLGMMLGSADNVLSTASGLPSGAVYNCDGTWCEVFGDIAGRFRLNVKGTPKCNEVVNEETTCTFNVRYAFSFSKQLGNLPFQNDPILEYAERVLRGSMAQISDVVVSGRFISREDAWVLEGDLISSQN